MIRPPNHLERQMFRAAFAVFLVLGYIGLALMANGTTMLDSSGNLKVNTDGTGRLADGTSDGCCCTVCPNCASDKNTYTVTITGTSVNGGTSCINCTGYNLQWSAAGTVDGTYTLTRDADCIWSVIVSMSSINQKRYNFTGVCTGPPNTTKTYNAINVQLINFGPGFPLFTALTAEFGSGSTFGARIFEHNLYQTTICWTPSSLANQTDTNPCIENQGGGGSAVIS